MTRDRAPGGVPSVKVADYAARRVASELGLILTEGIASRSIIRPRPGWTETLR